MRRAMMRNVAMLRSVARSWSGRTGRVVGVRHMQAGSDGGEGGITVTGTEEAGMGSEMMQQQQQAYSSSPQHENNSKECDASHRDDKPQPSARFVKQNAERVKASMNTKNT